MISRDDYGKYIIIQIIGFIVCPVISFVMSILTYKNAISQFFFILFAFYFGYKIDCILDLRTHYDNFLYFSDVSLVRILENREIYNVGYEPYHILLKYLISKIDFSSRFFAGCAAAIYAVIFVCYIRQFKKFYIYKLNPIQFLSLCGIVFTVEYYWYLGVRYWSGAFFFLIFYMKYVFTYKRKYLFIACFSIFFHVAHLLLIVAVCFNILLGSRKKILYLFVVISLLFRNAEGYMYYFIDKVPLLKLYLKEDYYDENKREASVEKTAFFREDGNIVYQNRTSLLFYTFLILLFLLWRKNKKVNTDYPELYSFLLILFCISNILYSSIVAYERIFKLLVVVCYSYLFLILHRKNNIWLNSNKILIVAIGAVMFFSILTTIVQQRNYLFDLSLWFDSLIFRL